MTKRTPNFARVLAPTRPANQDAAYRSPDEGDDGPLAGAEIDAVLELGFVMANANGDASYDELEAFRALVKYLRPEAQVANVLDEMTARLEKADSIEARVRAAVKNLKRRVARELAYKAAYTIAVFDLETNEEERELEDLLIEALGIDDVRARDLAFETNDALST